MKYLKVAFLLVCISQITGVINAVTNQIYYVAKAMNPILLTTNANAAINEVVNQANAIAQQQDLSFQEAMDQLAARYGIGSGTMDNIGYGPMSDGEMRGAMPVQSTPPTPQKKTTQIKLINRIAKNMQSLQNDVAQLQKLINA